MNHLEMFKVNALKDLKVVLIFEIESPNFYYFVANKNFDTFVSDLRLHRDRANSSAAKSRKLIEEARAPSFVRNFRPNAHPDRLGLNRPSIKRQMIYRMMCGSSV